MTATPIAAHNNAMNRRETLIAVVAIVLTSGLMMSFMTRYQLATTEKGSAYKLDSWTGKAWFCIDYYHGIERSCLELQDRKPGFDDLDAELEQFDKKDQGKR